MTAYAELHRALAPGTPCQALWYFERFDFVNAIALAPSGVEGPPHPPSRLRRFRLRETASAGQVGEAGRASLEAFARVTVPRGRPLDLRGAGDDVFVLTRGKVHIADVSRTGRLMTRTLLRDGDVFGACDIADAGSLGQAAEAWADCELWVIPCASFKTIVSDTPSLRVRLTRMVNGRECAFERRVDELVLSSAEARTARTFISLARQHGLASDDGLHIPVALTYRELGQLVGLSDATVRQILGSWCVYGLLETADGMLRLCDPAGLQRIAAGGPVMPPRAPDVRPIPAATPAPASLAQAAAALRAMKLNSPSTRPGSRLANSKRLATSA